MKKLLLALCLSTATLLTANNPTLYRDEDSGLVIQIPENMVRTWNLSNCQWGMEINVFQTESLPVYAIVAGRLPLTSILGEGNEGLLTSFIPQIQEGFGDLLFTLEELPSLASDEYPSQRFRVSIIDEEDEDDMQIAIDFHLFLRDTTASFVGTMVAAESPEETDLDQLSYSVLESVRFIDE